MSDTRLLGGRVEDAVRVALSVEFGVEFSKRRLPLRSGGRFSFDAVSADGRVVVSIKSSRGTTRGGKPPTGAIKAAIADLYFLSLVDADRRILVLTDIDFYKRLSHDLKGRTGQGLELKHVPLPTKLALEVQTVLDRASREMPSKVD
jgi:hypothetical protein